MTARRAISATSSMDSGRAVKRDGATKRPITRLPLLDVIYGAEWAEHIQRAAFAPKGKKRAREAELKAYVTDRLKAAMPAQGKAA